MLTIKQTRAFWRSFSATCRELGLDGREERETYRHQVMMAEAGERHLACINRLGGYERVMARLASDRGDWQEAGRYAIGDDRRFAAMTADCAEQIFDILGAGEDASGYIESIMRQARFAPPCRDGFCWTLDVPAELMLKVFQMLDTHRRRLLKRADVCSDGPYLGYVYGRRWCHLADGMISWYMPDSPEPKFKVILAASRKS